MAACGGAACGTEAAGGGADSSVRLEARVAAVEARALSVASTFDVDGGGVAAAVIRVRDDALRRGLLGCALARVPPHYYSLPLVDRAALLQCPASRLCKLLLFANSSSAATDAVAAPISRARYVGVVLQYGSKLDMGALQSWLSSRPDAPPDVRLSLADDGEAVTGFVHNALSPLGSARPLHLVVTKAIARLPVPAFVWLGKRSRCGLLVACAVHHTARPHAPCL